MESVLVSSLYPQLSFPQENAELFTQKN